MLNVALASYECVTNYILQLSALGQQSVGCVIIKFCIIYMYICISTTLCGKSVCGCVFIKNDLNRGKKDNRRRNPFIFTHQSTALGLAHTLLIMSTWNQATSRPHTVEISSSVHTELTPACCVCTLLTCVDSNFEESGFRVHCVGQLHIRASRKQIGVYWTVSLQDNVCVCRTLIIPLVWADIRSVYMTISLLFETNDTCIEFSGPPAFSTFQRHTFRAHWQLTIDLNRYFVRPLQLCCGYVEETDPLSKKNILLLCTVKNPFSRTCSISSRDLCRDVLQRFSIPIKQIVTFRILWHSWGFTIEPGSDVTILSNELN